LRRSCAEDFLNVDVDVWSRTSLQPLVDALGEKVDLHYLGSEGEKQSAHFSLARSYGKDADRLTRHLAGLVKRLPPAARKHWNHARARDFNIGIQGGQRPFSHELSLEAETLKLVADVDGRIVITTYGLPVEQPRRKRGNRTHGRARKARG
jgi:hypothetical protein